ncbi:MAG: hypothetical protein K9M07_06015 [Simkaniaceae bacterium]|nr:hypothetical protein [Simkaniaceae bacterium]MCF7852777.1 hypothetical protein [Simkaniaceae bacterium]
MSSKLKQILIATMLLCAPFAAYGASKAIENKPLTEQAQTPYNQLQELDQHYVAQAKDHYDAVASGVITTNTLLAAETAQTQETFFNEKMKGILEPAIVAARGMELDELKPALQAQGLKASIHYATTVTNEELSAIILDVVSSPEQVMIVQYDQSFVSMHDGVTYGIVADYDVKAQKVLIMNVNPAQKKLNWIKVDQFLKGMKALNQDHCPRGFIIVSKPVLDVG